MLGKTQNLVVLAAALVVHPLTANAERLLFDNPDYIVTTAGEQRCGQPVTIALETGNPDLLESESKLQGVVDATRAVLAYECPTVGEIEMLGHLRGIADPVFRGIAHSESGWQLETRQSFDARAEGESWRDERPENAAPDNFNVANLTAGMVVEEARSTVSETFGVEPSYDNREGTLSMRKGGCREDYDWAALSPPPDAGWKCLRAWFTDERMERLYLVELIQVVEGRQVASIETFLSDQFGEPVHRSRSDGQEGWWQDEPSPRTLAWGEVVDTTPVSDGDEQASRYTLQARVVPLNDVTVLVVTLYEPDIRPGRAAQSEQPPLDLNL